MKALRFLADENFPGQAVRLLRSKSYDVAWIAKESPGSSDAEILLRIAKEKRVLLTFDKDFSLLAFRSKLSKESGIILFTIELNRPETVAKKALQILQVRDDWQGYFSTIAESRYHMLPLF